MLVGFLLCLGHLYKDLCRNPGIDFHFCLYGTKGLNVIHHDLTLVDLHAQILFDLRRHILRGDGAKQLAIGTGLSF